MEKGWQLVVEERQEEAAKAIMAMKVVEGELMG